MVFRRLVSRLYPITMESCVSIYYGHTQRRHQVWHIQQFRLFSSPSSLPSSDNPVQVDHTTTKTDNTPPTSPSPNQPSRRQRQQGRSKKQLEGKNVPSYREFVHRFTVLSMYRGYLRAINKTMPHNRSDLHEQVRKEFRTHMADTDPFNIQRALAEGKRRFEELQQLTGGDNNNNGGNSWMNIQDDEDPRGRVGHGWPWQK